MKATLINVITISIILLTGFTAQADEIIKNITAHVEDKAIIVEMDDLQGATATCKIFDTHGVTVFSERIGVQPNLSKKYNVSQLNDGTYRLVVDDLLKKEVIEFRLKNNQITYVSSVAVTTYKPTFRTNDNKVHMNWMVLSQPCELTVIHDGVEVHKENYVDENVVSKTFDLTQALEGEYTIITRINDETFYNLVRI